MDYDALRKDMTLVDPNSDNVCNFDNIVVNLLVNVLLGLGERVRILES